MYNYKWAESRVHELIAVHTRASDILVSFFDVSRRDLILWLQQGSTRWEDWKFFLRMVELGMGIRTRPNTSEYLDTKQAYSILWILLKNPGKGERTRALTDISFWRTLVKHGVSAGGGRAQSIEVETTVDFDGQLFLFGERRTIDLT